MMTFTPRTLIGFGAGFASMAFVLLAGFTGPDTRAASLASTCPDSQQVLPQSDREAEAERPA